jgi:hypothetical protein
MFPIFRRFSLNPGGDGEGGMDGEGSVHCRPGRYGKERRVGPQGGYPFIHGLSRADRYIRRYLHHGYTPYD